MGFHRWLGHYYSGIKNAIRAVNYIVCLKKKKSIDAESLQTFLRLVYRHPCKDAPGPAISVDHGLLDEQITPEPRHENGPDEVVHGTGREDCNGHDAVQVVGQFVVNVLVGRGWHVRRNHEVHVGQEEENGDWEGCADAGGPVGVACRLGQVDPDQTGRDENVDDGKGVGNEAVYLLVPSVQNRSCCKDIAEGTHLTRKL